MVLTVRNVVAGLYSWEQQLAESADTTDGADSSLSAKRLLFSMTAPLTLTSYFGSYLPGGGAHAAKMKLSITLN